MVSPAGAEELLQRQAAFEGYAETALVALEPLGTLVFGPTVRRPASRTVRGSRRGSAT
jgi:hypothetical protein